MLFRCPFLRLKSLKPSRWLVVIFLRILGYRIPNAKMAITLLKLISYIILDFALSYSNIVIIFSQALFDATLMAYIYPYTLTDDRRKCSIR